MGNLKVLHGAVAEIHYEPTPGMIYIRLRTPAGNEIHLVNTRTAIAT